MEKLYSVQQASGILPAVHIQWLYKWRILKVLKKKGVDKQWNVLTQKNCQCVSNVRHFFKSEHELFVYNNIQWIIAISSNSVRCFFLNLTYKLKWTNPMISLCRHWKGPAPHSRSHWFFSVHTMMWWILSYCWATFLTEMGKAVAERCSAMILIVMGLKSAQWRCSCRSSARQNAAKAPLISAPWAVSIVLLSKSIWTLWLWFLKKTSYHLTAFSWCKWDPNNEFITRYPVCSED